MYLDFRESRNNIPDSSFVEMYVAIILTTNMQYAIYKG
jgi:hypothetical protein